MIQISLGSLDITALSDTGTFAPPIVGGSTDFSKVANSGIFIILFFF